MSERSPEERERARWEREVRRARREGRPEPPPPASLDDADTVQRGQAPLYEEPDTVQRGQAPLHDPGPPTEAFTPPFVEEEEVDDDFDEEDEHDEVPSGTRRGIPERLRHLHLPHRPEPPPAPAPRRPRRGRGVTVGRIAAVIAVLLIAFLGWFLVSLFQPFHGKGKGDITVRIPEGASARQVGDLLEKRHVISSSFFFSLRATLSGDRSKLGSGTYHLRHDMSYGAALSALTKPPTAPKTVSVTLPEGSSIREWAPLVRKDGLTGSYLAATRERPPSSLHARGAHTLEGFLFPATYTFKAPGTAKELIGQQLATFQSRFRQIDMRYAHSKNLGTYDVVKIASMVEREAATAHDRPLVAAVIYNRLKAGMTLGIDATLRYRLNFWSGQLRQSQLANPTAYNTRLHKGLPPTPIGNPGLAALQAAAHPAKVSYLYYVAQPGSCNQAFSTSYQKFLANQRRYQRALAKKHGSPTKCP